MCCEAGHPPSVSSLRHDAFVYERDREFVDRLAPFMRRGLAEGAAALAVTTQSNWAMLRGALGSASEQISFIDRDEWYLRPEETISRYDATLRDLAGGGAPSVRVIGEVGFGSDPDGWNKWTAYEAVINHALAPYNAWIVCPYDARALPRRVVEDAWRTHAQVLTDGWHSSADYDDPQRVVRDLTAERDPLRQFLPA